MNENKLRINRSRHPKKQRNGWGAQIRSYILDCDVVKDHKTGIESNNVKLILDGDLDIFILPALKIGGK